MMAKRFLAVVFLLCVVLPLCGCDQQVYKESDFIGKTSAQIEAEFGPFDCLGKKADADGLYRGTSCGYTMLEPRVGFLGTDPEILFFICFDENGIACECYEGYRPGG